MIRITLTFAVIAATALLVDGRYAGAAEPGSRPRRAVADVRNCDVSPPVYPETTFQSAPRVNELRRYMGMTEYQYEAYIIPGYDEHGSEYPADPDRRIYYISGFNGTGGFAIVTLEKRALWTEQRFELLAQQQLDCDWEIMVLGDSDFLTPWEWLIRDDRRTDPDDDDFIPGAGLPSMARVGYDPRLMPYKDWFELSETNRLEVRTMNLRAHDDENNLVDLTWKRLEGKKDPYPGEKLFVQDEDVYAGYTWREKIYSDFSPNPENFKNLRQVMAEKGADLLILTQLDEVAWLFNLRGEDIPYNPLFISYAAIAKSYIYLYMFDANVRLDEERYSEVRQHLGLDTPQCSSDTSTCISVQDISNFYTDLTNIGQNLVFSEKVWFSNSTNYFVYDKITSQYDDQDYIMEPSPILKMKAVKNSKEREVMMEALEIDSVNMIEMVTWMDGLLQDMNDPKAGDRNILTEFMVSERTETVREVQVSYMYPSYETVAAFGENSADFYYHPDMTTDNSLAITTGKMFLYDMGSQYREGTTTQTRTFFFAKEDEFPNGYRIEEPTDLEKELYTRVLLGHIDLANSSFRSNVYGRDLDSIARQHLWDVGLDYLHPTGYGLGQYLTVHEAPVTIGDSTLDETFHENMIMSNGPGYYYVDPDGNQENDFGVRITSAMRVVRSETPFDQGDQEYFEFEMLTYVPFEPRLINFHLFTRKQLEWYNNYNELIRDKLEGKLSSNAKEWMLSRTRFQKYDFDYIGAAPPRLSATTILALTLLSVCVVMNILK